MGYDFVTISFCFIQSAGGIEKISDSASAQRRFSRSEKNNDFTFEDRISHGISDVCHVYRSAGHAGSGQFPWNRSSSRIYGSIQGRSGIGTGQ